MAAKKSTKSTKKKSTKRAGSKRVTKKVSMEKAVEKGVEQGIENTVKKAIGKHKSCKTSCSCHKTGGCIWFLGFVGAAVYYISTATGFWHGLWGVIKALVWPAIVVFKLLAGL